MTGPSKSTRKSLFAMSSAQWPSMSSARTTCSRSVSAPKNSRRFPPALLDRRQCQCGEVPWRHLFEKSASQKGGDRSEELIERIAFVDESGGSGPQPGIRPVAVVRRVNDAHLEACLTEAADEGGSRRNVEGSGVEKHEIRPPVDPTFDRRARSP